MAVKNEDMYVVDGQYLLPLSDALTLVGLLARATYVDREWGTGKPPFKFVTEGQRDLVLRKLSVAQLAQMELERDNRS